MVTSVSVRVGESGVYLGVLVGGDGGVGVEIAEENAAVARTREDVFSVRVVPVFEEGGLEGLAGVVVGLDGDGDPEQTGVGVGRRGDGGSGSGGSCGRTRG